MRTEGRGVYIFDIFDESEGAASASVAPMVVSPAVTPSNCRTVRRVGARSCEWEVVSSMPPTLPISIGAGKNDTIYQLYII